MVLSEATVRVTLEVSQFERDLRAKVTDAANKAGRDFDREMRSQLSDTGKNASDDFRNAARTNMSRAGRDSANAFDTEFRTGLSQTGSKAGDKLSQGLRTSVSRAGLDAGRGFADNVGNALEASGADTGQRFVDSIATGIERRGARAGRAVGASIDSAATTEARKSGEKAGSQFSQSFAIGVIKDTSPLVQAGVALGAYAYNAAKPSLGIFAAFPSLLGAVTASAIVTVTAFKGMGTAIKALGTDDIKKINAAMADLSPQAQSVVREFSAARPALQGLKSDIQDAFFGQLGGQVHDLAAAFTGDLRPGIVGVGTSLGSLARQFTSTFTQAQGVSNLDKLFTGTSGFLDRLAPGLANLNRGFLTFTGAAAPGLKDIGQALSDMFTHLGQFLNRSATSGQALAWVEKGLTGLRELGGDVVDLVHAFTTLLSAASPLAFLLGGMSHVVVDLVNAFGNLPGPIQTAALAAVLLSRSGLPEFIKKTTDAGGPAATTLTSMATGYRQASDQARTFINTGAGLAGFGAATGRAFDTVTGKAESLATGLRTGLGTAINVAADGLSRAGQAAQVGFVRAMLEVDSATTRTTAAVRTGFERASTATGVALNRMSIAGRDTADTLRAGLIPTALAIDANVTRAQGALSRFGGILTGTVVNSARTAATAVQNAGTMIATGFARSIQAAENGATAFGTAVHTGIIAASIAGNNALTTVGNTLRNSVLRPLVDATGAYRTASSGVREFATSQAALNGPLGQSPGLLGRVRDGFTELRAVASGSSQALGSLASGPLSAAKRGIELIGSTAAGVGGAITKGLGSAVSGLSAAFGGPWGLAIAGATAALGFLSSAQDEARQAAAEHAAEISTLADTLNKETGAVTAATKQSLLNKIATSDTGDQARKLGINLNLVADAATGNTTAQAQLYEALRKSAEAGGFTSQQMKTLQDTSQKTGVSVNDLELALLGNQDALGKVKGAFGAAGIDLNQWSAGLVTGLGNQNQLSHSVNQLAGDLAVQQAHIRDAANAMTPAQATAQKYADAIGVLADKSSDADQKSRALADALNILAGGTVDAEVAQGKFTDLLKSLGDGLDTATKGLGGMGSAMLTNEGRINTQSQAGAFLVGQYKQITDALSTSVGATIEAGRASGDLDGALIKVGQQTADARAQFIQTAQQLGLNKDQANRLADAYGLIPAQVLTTVTDQGSALNVQLQIAAVGQKIKDLPPNTPVRVEGLTSDAIQKLNEVGIKTKTLPDGSVEVTATTMEAKAQLDQLIRSYQGRVINFATSIMGGKAMGDIVHNAIGRVIRYGDGGQYLRSMPANRAEIVGANTWRVIGDRASGDEAFIPINSSGRSRMLLAETARRMGFRLFGDGGMNGGMTSGPVTQIAAGAIVVNAPYSDPALVAKATLNELARSAVG